MMQFGRLGACIAAAAAAAALLATAASAQQGKARCVLAGGEATMVTEDLAKFMAEAALKNSITGMGAKAAGDVRMSCKRGVASTYCLAQQRACR